MWKGEEITSVPLVSPDDDTKVEMLLRTNGDNKVGVDRQTPYLVMSTSTFGAGIGQMCALKNSGVNQMDMQLSKTRNATSASFFGAPLQ